jgi:Lipid A 3-O-deacylase (PagL)
MRLARFTPAILLLCSALTSVAQQASDPTYSRLNTFSGFFEYANDSSHIILGNADNRKIGAIGFQYQRRLVHRRLLDFSYTAEVRPGMIESDPEFEATITFTAPTHSVSQILPSPVDKCVATTYVFNGENSGGGNYADTEVTSCTRRTVIEQGFSPGGIRISLLPRHRLQPTFSTLAGYMFSTQQVPVTDAGSFNYTFEFGGGLEYYLTQTRSMRLEYQVQHYSNKKTADLNPGVDAGFFKLTYAFGH